MNFNYKTKCAYRHLYIQSYSNLINKTKEGGKRKKKRLPRQQIQIQNNNSFKIANEMPWKVLYYDPKYAINNHPHGTWYINPIQNCDNIKRAKRNKKVFIYFIWSMVSHFDMVKGIHIKLHLKVE